MNKAEYNHYHGYQDAKDALNDRIQARVMEIQADYWYQPGMVAEAISEHIANNESFIALVLHLRTKNDFTAIGQLLIDTIDDYLADRADQEATDEI